MTDRRQAPIGSGFHAKTTAEEAIAGINLTGKNAIVTGGYSGIGLETVRALAAAGAHVHVPARRPDVARNELASIDGQINVGTMDLGDLASVKRFAEGYGATGEPLHLLINNAAIMACPEARVGPGWESQFGVNHMGHFALTAALRPALQRAQGARIVALSSTAHRLSDILWDDPQFTSGTYDKWVAYGQAKTANALFALAADQKWASDGIRAFSVHPGGIFTPLQRHLADEEMVALGWKNADGTIPPAVAAIFKTPSQGASTTIFAATSAKLDGLGGLYCEDGDVAHAATASSKGWEHAREWICDEDKAERLWTMSESLLAAA